MSDAVEFIAVLSCTLFTGAAIYINLVEHPARMGCGTKIAATVWAPSYKRATVMQASLAVISFLTGVVSWLLGRGILWLLGAMLIGLVVPFTFIAIMPTNRRLLAPGRDLDSSETRLLLEKWSTIFHRTSFVRRPYFLILYTIILSDMPRFLAALAITQFESLKAWIMSSFSTALIFSLKVGTVTSPYKLQKWCQNQRHRNIENENGWTDKNVSIGGYKDNIVT